MRKILLLTLVLLTAAAPALAHKMRVFATAQGATVTGQVHLSGDAGAAGVPVTVFLGDDRVVARTETGPDGTFAFDAQHRADHIIVAESDGHQSTWTLRASELPAALPALDGPATVPAPQALAAAPQRATAVTDATVAALVDQAVARQIAPLRSEMQAWREESRWRDIAGGLGWIIGLSGLIAWAAARRKG